MLLAIDVGNTQTHIGVFDAGKLIHEWRASTDARRTADELALLFGEFLALEDLEFQENITGMVVSSVVPRSTQELRELSARYFGFRAVVVEAGTRTGIAIHTDNPREVGADRIANAVAAHDAFPGSSVVVVDFGTAITVDAISAKGDYLGGSIAPGIDTSATALFSATAQIRRVELTAPPSAIGKTTVTSVQSGIMYGTAALVDGLVDRVAEELDGQVEVVATGGFASTIVEHCRTIDRIDPLLTLNGLRLIYDRNEEPR